MVFIFSSNSDSIFSNFSCFDCFSGTGSFFCDFLEDFYSIGFSFFIDGSLSVTSFSVSDSFVSLAELMLSSLSTTFNKSLEVCFYKSSLSSTSSTASLIYYTNFILVLRSSRSPPFEIFSAIFFSSTFSMLIIDLALVVAFIVPTSVS